MKASGVFMYKGITQRDGGTFKNDKGEDVSYNSCMVLTCDEIQEDGTGMETKVYNKKKESNLDIFGDLTRIEISRSCDDYPISEIARYKFGDNFPEIYLNQYVMSLSEFQDKTLMAILYAVQNGYPMCELSKAYKTKLKEMFEGGYKINFYQKYANSVLQQVIYHYFVPNVLMRWR